ncbi:MAG: ABC transporter substrate-binding protein [Bacteroidales bacterium]|nr:ABC transporter substrate-binding protein [Bacteroidales bacterium]
MKRCLILALSLILAFCHRSGQQVADNAAGEGSSSAAYFIIKGNDTLISLSSWDLSVDRYVLVPRDSSALLAADPMAIPYPIESCVCMSTTYLPHIKLIGKAESVKGVSGTRFIYDSLYSSRASNGLIADVGAETAPDYEKILSLKADVVLAYGIEGSDNSYIEKLRKLGQKVVVINDYLEHTVTGRLEYLKLFGKLFGKEAVADSVFKARKEEYLNARQLCAEVEKPAKALVNMPFKGIWYLPGNNSYMAELVRDAGGEIIGAEEGECASSQKSFEHMYSLALESDVWIHLNSARSKAEVLAENPLFKNIPAFKSGQMYNNVKRVTPEGGSDFWESGAVNPAEILKDLIQIFHPDIAEKNFPGREMVYYIKLDE